MIKNVSKIIIGAETVGFDAHTNDLSLIVGAGTIRFYSHQENDPDKIEEYTFPAFTFDVVPDSELDVTYDIYLCSDNTVAVERIELLDGVIPCYSGEKELLHCLSSFTIAPNIASLDSTLIEITTLQKGDDNA